MSIDCFRIKFPKDMDANEFLMLYDNPGDAFGQLIRNAEWMGSGKPPKIATASDIDVPEAVLIKAAEKETSAELTSTAIVGSSCANEQQPLNQAINPQESATISSSAAQPAADASVQHEPLAPIQASPIPSVPKSGLIANTTNEGVFIQQEARLYRVRGLEKNTTIAVLKVNVMVSQGEVFHTDSLDMSNESHRMKFVKQAAFELRVPGDVMKKEVARLLLKLEEMQLERIKQAVEPERTEQSKMTDTEQKAALALLKDPKLIDRIPQAFRFCGVVGEITNISMCYIACVSRLLEKPLAILTQSFSSAGKSAVMNAALLLMPQEEQEHYSAITGQSLFYAGEIGLQHKILAIAEEQGAANASYALKILQSEGKLNIASTGKDPITGRLQTQEYNVEGPVMLFLTTTSVDLDEELQNRCITLTADESREQTREIHKQQRFARTLEGIDTRIDRQDVITLHQNAQRLLRPLQVVNPYAYQLTFLDEKTRTRRDHEKYLAIIDSIALLHQHQRPVKTRTYKGHKIHYIEVTVDDIALSNRFANEVLGRTIDELPPQTRCLLQLIHRMVDDACRRLGLSRSDYRFTRKDIREYARWGNTQLKIHLRRLQELEYLLVHRGSRGQSFVYELLYDGEGQEGELFLMGLIDVEKLRHDDNKAGANAEKAEPSRPQVGAKSGPSRVGKTAENDENSMGYEDVEKNAENSILGDFENDQQSYLNDRRSVNPVNPLPLVAKGEDD